MSITNTCPLWMAQKAAERIVEQLRPSCERIVIAGSIRREQQVVNDIEIVATPRRELVELVPPGEMFPQKVQFDRLESLCGSIEGGLVPGIRRPKSAEGCRMPAWGPRFKALCAEYSPGRWIALDLFIVARGSWGPLLTLRTGPADFSKLLVTHRTIGGAMPSGMRMRDGALQHRVDQSKPEDDPEAWEPLFIAEEPEFFETLKLKFIEPRLRSVRSLRLALGGLV